MKLNDDFSRRACVHAGAMDWTPSPTAGVERKMLDRIGGEVARATTIVRYAAGSRFPAHVHRGGEEYLVLEGVFQDEAGDFPAGTYVRNPPQSRHAPGSDGGCTIFVKLWQFDPADRTHVRAAPAETAFATSPQDGRATAELHHDERESVRLERWSPRQKISLNPSGGLELLVLDGDLTEGGEHFTRWSWLRLPIGARLDATAGPDGCRLWVKEGHLRFATANTPATA